MFDSVFLCFKSDIDISACRSRFSDINRSPTFSFWAYHFLQFEHKSLDRRQVDTIYTERERERERERVFWSKKIVVSDTSSFEQFVVDLKLTSSSLKNVKLKLKDHFFKKLTNMEQNTFAYWHHIRNLNCSIFN